MSKRVSVALALLTMVLWGSLFPMVKRGFAAYAVEGVADILLFAGVRFVICGGVICAFCAVFRRSHLRTARGSLAPILLSGVFAILLHYGFTYLGLELTDSSKTALLKQAGTLLYVCFSFLFIKGDAPSGRKLASAAIGACGILALNFDAGAFSFGIGELLILLASLCTVASNVISKQTMKAASPIAFTGISQLFGGALLLVLGILMGGSLHVAFDSSLWIMGYICLASTVSYLIWFGVVKRADLSHLFIIKLSEPLFACLFGALILGEDISRLSYLVAFLLIAASILLSTIQRKPKEKEKSLP